VAPSSSEANDVTQSPRVLYIASGGIKEPLIVSQVLRYLKRLSGTFETCHLLTLEREMPADATAIADQLKQHGIHWQGLPSRRGLRAINLWREIYAGYRTGLRLIKTHKLNLIHSRSFIPGNIGLRLAKKTSTKFLYDMRGFWAEEKKAKGTIKADWMFRRAQAMENRLFNRADALVSLTEAGKQKLIADGVQTPMIGPNSDPTSRDASWLRLEPSKDHFRRARRGGQLFKSGKRWLVHDRPKFGKDCLQPNEAGRVLGLWLAGNRQRKPNWRRWNYLATVSSRRGGR